MEKASNSERESEQINFNPPLYIQRDLKILDIIDDKYIESVVDLGCAECRLIKKLKECKNLKYICGIDIERDLLESSTHILEPLPWNFMFPRFDPLRIVILHGSMLEPDEIMFDCDAVILSEVIEHLVVEDLEALPEVVFNSLRPRTCIMTTPNSEFNVVFGDSFVGFRHPDHKFEWTRNEFSEWCNGITRRYPYSVEFDGVGDPPPSHPDVGFCTQIAIFRCLTSPEESIFMDAETIKTTHHVRVAEINYPYEDRLTSTRRRAVTRIYSILERETSSLRGMEEPPCQPDGNNSWLCNECVYVSLKWLMEDEVLKNCFEDMADMRNVLVESDIVLHKDGEFIEYCFGAPSSEDEEDKYDN